MAISRRRIVLAVTAAAVVVAGVVIAFSCMNPIPRPTEAQGTSETCELVSEGFGPKGAVSVRAEPVVTGLEVPWAFAFLSEGTLLVTERPGRLRLVEDWRLLEAPIATVAQSETSEGGLLGLVLHPQFDDNRFFYLYRTVSEEEPYNRVERWRLSEDRRSASLDRIVVDKIPAATYHNGGRLRFGPDGMLYIGTGDAREPDLSQDSKSLAGKLLRVTAEGDVPSDNPWPGSASYLIGLRNLQAFDWLNDEVIVLADHGPSGEMMRFGHDEINVARKGQNLGWPDIYGCDSHPKMLSPSLTWEDAVPPGGIARYTGTAIPEWEDNFIVASLGARHLHRVVLDEQRPEIVTRHEVYLKEEYGRLREAMMGPDGELYITTSRCDGRGECPAQKDAILRITR